MGATLVAADYVASAGDLSQVEGVAGIVELALIDSIGVGLSASAGDLADALVAALAGERGDHAVIGRAERFTASTAALLNATLIHAEDWDDMGGCGGHPSAALFPPLLGLAEQTGASGRDIIDAYACGYQVGTVVGRYVTLDTQGLERPWHPSAVIGPIAATAAACRLLRLTAGQTANALGMSTSFSGGVRAQFGTHTKALHLGKAAMAGHLCATLARHGITGDTEAFERDNGFGACFAPGTSWRFMEHDLTGPLFVASRHTSNTVGFGIAAKPWPWCGGATSGIMALESIFETERLAAEDIEELVIHEAKDRAKGSLFRSPYTGVGEQGKFSLPYNLAARILFEDVGPHVHTDAAAAQVLASGLLPRIRVVVRPFDEPKPPVSRITIRTRDGRTLTGVSKSHRRESTRETIAAKFRDAAARKLSPQAAGEAITLLGDLRNVADAGRLLSGINETVAR